MPASLALIYSVYPDETAAAEAAEAALQHRLIACANIGASPVTSMYVWQGKAERSREIPVLFKTAPGKAEEAAAFLEKRHPYDCPPVITLSAGANAAFAQWAEESVN